MQKLNLEMAASLLPPRDAGANKGSFGHTLVLAGARGSLGAAQLAAHGALRSGTGLVTLAVPDCIWGAATSGLEECLTRGLPDTPEGSFADGAAPEAVRLARERSAAVIGPGLGTSDGAGRFLEGFLQLAPPAPMVLDADALNLIAMGAAVLPVAASIVLTPHPGEAARLLGESVAQVQADRASAARRLAGLGAEVAVLKGHGTVVAARDGRLVVNTTGGHGLAKGGSGDVLAGLIGGLLAQGLGSFDAACLGVFVHGLAGDLAQERHGARAMLARDVIDALGAAWQRIEDAV